MPESECLNVWIIMCVILVHSHLYHVLLWVNGFYQAIVLPKWLVGIIMGGLLDVIKFNMSLYQGRGNSLEFNSNHINLQYF